MLPCPITHVSLTHPTGLCYNPANSDTPLIQSGEAEKEEMVIKFYASPPPRGAHDAHMPREQFFSPVFLSSGAYDE
jgi:hypothetical protein